MSEQEPRRVVNASTAAESCPQPGARQTSPASVPTLDAGLFYSVFEKTLKVRATLDYGSRSLLQVGVHAIEERSSDLNVHTLFQGNAVSNVS